MSEVPWRAELEQRGRRLSVAMAAGLACGAVVGGVGGRLAMFLLRLTSDAALRGIKTDDDFVIGRFSYGAAIFASSASLTAVLPLILNLRTITRGMNGTRPVSGGGSGGSSKISGAGLRNCGAGSGFSEGSVSGGSGADGGGGAWPQAKLTAASRPRPASARNRRDGRKRAPARARQQSCSAGSHRRPAARV